MNFLGIGPPEVILILVLILIVLGPREMVKTATQIGKMIGSFLRSGLWRSIVDTSHEIRQMQTDFLKETGIQENIREFKQPAPPQDSPSLGTILPDAIGEPPSEKQTPSPNNGSRSATDPLKDRE